MIKEVHVEFACRDPIYAALKRWIPTHPQARLMLLVDSCPHCQHLLFPCHVYGRYKTLAALAPVGLHVHLAFNRHWWVSQLTYEEQYLMLQNGVEFLKDCGVEPSHFVPGNFKFDKDTLKACYALGLTIFHWEEREENKPTVSWAKEEYPRMQFVSALKCYTHDWTIHEKESKQ